MCMSYKQSNHDVTEVDQAPLPADGGVDGADGWTGSGHGHTRSDGDLRIDMDIDSGSHQRLPPSGPQLQHLVTSLQLELRESQATQMRTR